MRAVVKFLFSLIIVICIAWLGLWWYAQGRLQAGFEAWAATQAGNGLHVAYSGIQRGTSPFEALVTVSDLVVTLPPQPNGDTGTVTLPAVGLRIDAANPFVFHTDLPNKIAVQVGTNIDAAINTGSIAVSENLDPNALFNKTVYPFRGGDLDAANIDVLASQGSLLVLHIDTIIAHSDLNLGADSSQVAFSSTTTLDGIALSPILTRIASIPFDGKISHFSLGLSLSGPVPPGLADLITQVRAVPNDVIAQQKLIMPVVHKWAAQGGNGGGNVALIVGPTTASAAATIKFDPNLQPAGTADLTANHLDELTATLTNAYPQLQNAITQAEAQLSPYLTTTAQDGQALTMHTVYGSGTVSINGQKVADLPQVNWTNLENPQPPAPVAPAVPTTPGPAQ